MSPEEKATQLRERWDRTGAKRLKISTRPASDLDGDILKSPSDLVKNIKLRMKHLAEILAHLHKIYSENSELYGDRFLAFVGNEVVREWPWKDFPFHSEQALEILDSIESYTDISGLQLFEIKDKEVVASLSKLRYEHWTPISFFRDIFQSESLIDSDTFYQVLIKYYRIIWIDRKEDDLLNIENRSSRPLNTYKKLGINIVSNPSWNEFIEN
mgnify:CR=1 FL=1